MSLNKMGRDGSRGGKQIEKMVPSAAWRDPDPVTDLPGYGFAGDGGDRVESRPGRNDPCPCGSSAKFKKCCALKPQKGDS